LKFHFTEAYPELKYLTVDTSYNHDATWAIGEAPQAPVEEVEEALAPVALEL
jgi:hypothetical protein